MSQHQTTCHSSLLTPKREVCHIRDLIIFTKSALMFLICDVFQKSNIAATLSWHPNTSSCLNIIPTDQRSRKGWKGLEGGFCPMNWHHMLTLLSTTWKFAFLEHFSVTAHVSPNLPLQHQEKKRTAKSLRSIKFSQRFVAPDSVSHSGELQTADGAQPWTGVEPPLMRGTTRHLHEYFP